MRKRAFTLIEIIVVIALIALVAGVAVLRFDLLIPSQENLSPEKIVFRACATASHRAWTQKSRFFLRLHEDRSSIALEDSRGNILETFSLPAKEKNKRELRFRLDPRDGTRLFAAGNLAEISEIEFHPSGCATPSIIEITKDRKTEKIFQMDPFSGGLTECGTL